MTRADSYEINVAKKRTPDDEYGLHYCKIELPETSPSEAGKKFTEIAEMFGSSYNVTMTHWECRGYNVNLVKER